MPRNSHAASEDDFSPASLIARFTQVLGEAPADISEIENFITQVLEDYRPEELPDVGAADFATVLASFWRFAQSHGDEGPHVRMATARTADGRELEIDLLEVVQRDAPFLVDSVMGEVSEAAATVKAMFHPVIGEGPARRSMIQVWLEPMAESRRAALREGVAGAIADTRVAVADFKPMLALMRRSIDELKVASPGDPEILAEDIEFLRWMAAGHFVFLGSRCYDYPRTEDGGYAAEEPLYQPEDGLGVLRDASRRCCRRTSAVDSRRPSRWWSPSRISARGCIDGRTWTTSAFADTAPMASRPAKCASSASSPTRPMTPRPGRHRC